jgi:hypothetical protein
VRQRAVVLNCDDCGGQAIGVVFVPLHLDAEIEFQHIQDGVGADHPLTVRLSNGDLVQAAAIEWDRRPVTFVAEDWERRMR